MARTTSMLAALLLASTLAAQSLTISPGGGLTTGESATIEYTNSGMAGQSVTITVSGGFPVSETVEIKIKLDADGKGSAKWVVREWAAARFNAPGVHEVTEPIR